MSIGVHGGDDLLHSTPWLVDILICLFLGMAALQGILAHDIFALFYPQLVLPTLMKDLFWVYGSLRWSIYSSELTFLLHLHLRCSFWIFLAILIHTMSSISQKAGKQIYFVCYWIEWWCPHNIIIFRLNINWKLKSLRHQHLYYHTDRTTILIWTLQVVSLRASNMTTLLSTPLITIKPLPKLSTQCSAHFTASHVLGGCVMLVEHSNYPKNVKNNENIYQKHGNVIVIAWNIARGILCLHLSPTHTTRSYPFASTFFSPPECFECIFQLTFTIQWSFEEWSAVLYAL